MRSKSHSVRSALLWFLQIQRVVFSLRALQGPFTGYIAAGLVVVVCIVIGVMCAVVVRVAVG